MRLRVMIVDDHPVLFGGAQPAVELAADRIGAEATTITDRHSTSKLGGMFSAESTARGGRVHALLPMPS